MGAGTPPAVVQAWTATRASAERSRSEWCGRSFGSMAICGADSCAHAGFPRRTASNRTGIARSLEVCGESRRDHTHADPLTRNGGSHVEHHHRRRRRRTRGPRGRGHRRPDRARGRRRDRPRVARAQAGRHRAAVAAGQGRLGSRRGRPARGIRARRRPSSRRSPRSRRCSRTRRRTSRLRQADFEVAGRGLRRARLLDSLVVFQPQRHRVDGIRHLVVFPMYTQNGSTDRHVEALSSRRSGPSSSPRSRRATTATSCS